MFFYTIGMRCCASGRSPRLRRSLLHGAQGSRRACRCRRIRIFPLLRRCVALHTANAAFFPLDGGARVWHGRGANSRFRQTTGGGCMRRSTE
jgi:hypothetical protein